MANVPLTFLLVALVILLGFLTSKIFQSTRVPDVPLLMCIGLVLGPLNRASLDLAPSIHSEVLATTFNVDTFREILPFLSQLALIIILFDSGLKLDFRSIAKSLRPAMAHTFPLMTFTIAAIAVVAKFVWGFPTIVAVALGVALSNVGQTVSAAIIREMRIPNETKAIYFVEMAFYDVLSIPILVALLEFGQTASGGTDWGLFAQTIARIASVSLLFGILGGLVWIYVLRKLENYPYTYMVTLASLLLVYSLNSYAGGSGAVAALVFGLIIGNRTFLLEKLHVRHVPQFDIESEKVHTFHDEITFFIRSFFFVFLGIIFSTGGAPDGDWNVAANWWPLILLNGTAGLFLVGALVILVAIIGVRILVVRVISAYGHPERISLWAVYGRGLGTAVLCAFPFAQAAYIDRQEPYYSLFHPFEEIFFNVALLIVLLTVVGSSMTVFIEERRLRKAEAKPTSA